MKTRYFFLLLSLVFLISCEKEPSSDIPLNESALTLVVGDTSSCDLFDFEGCIYLFSDTGSVDINNDDVADIGFTTLDFLDDCEEFYKNCDTTMICDCWPVIYREYYVHLTSNTEIAINPDSTARKFSLSDSLSYKTSWACFAKYPLLKIDPINLQWSHNKFYLGFRNVENADTSYSWINLELLTSGFKVISWATKNK